MALNFNLPEDGGQFYVQNIAARQCLHINASRSAKTVPLFATSCNFKGSDRPAGIWQTNLTTPSDTNDLLPRSNDGSQSYKILFLFLGEFMSTPNINSGTGVVAERVATTGSKTKWVVSASRTSIAYNIHLLQEKPTDDIMALTFGNDNGNGQITIQKLTGGPSQDLMFRSASDITDLDQDTDPITPRADYYGNGINI